MKPKLIAPCGMNCSICKAFLRDERKCPGCRNIIKIKDKSKYRRECIIRNCSVLKEKDLKFCSKKCQKYPCQRLKNLDKRYRTKYEMSMLENLENIEKKGVQQFILNEKKRWQKGNKIYCVHDKQYYDIKN